MKRVMIHWSFNVRLYSILQDCLHVVCPMCTLSDSVQQADGTDITFLIKRRCFEQKRDFGATAFEWSAHASLASQLLTGLDDS